MHLPPFQSAFLWGPRKTGKTTYLKKAFPASVRYDLLETDLQDQFAKEPARLRHEVLALSPGRRAKPIIIDEVQKVPALLDEVHWLIENASVSFILCGSSPRKLRRGAANLLGGRAWRYRMFPLTSREIPGFDLLRALNAGLIPSHYTSPDPARSLRAYVGDYLKEEIRAEALARKVPAFSRFLDALAFGAGEMTNFANVARDCGVDAKTVKEYYRILVDTLVAYLVYPYSKRAGRDIITATPKHYWCDVGIQNALSGQQVPSLRGPYAGKLFEGFVLMELMAFLGYRDLGHEVQYWRTKTGLEVDFVIGGRAAVEATISPRAGPRDLRGLRAFLDEHEVETASLVCLEPRARRIDLGPRAAVTVLPWQDFLERLWGGRIIA